MYVFITDKFNTNKPRLWSPLILLFNRLTKGLLLRFNIPTIMCDNDESNHAAWRSRQPQSNNETDTCVNISLLHTGLTVAGQCKDGEPWMQKNDNLTWITRSNWMRLEDQSGRDRTHYNHNQATCDSQPHISRGPPQKWGNDKYQRVDRW